jgi:hypothetical protein
VAQVCLRSCSLTLGSFARFSSGLKWRLTPLEALIVLPVREAKTRPLSSYPSPISRICRARCSLRASTAAPVSGTLRPLPFFGGSKIGPSLVSDRVRLTRSVPAFRSTSFHLNPESLLSPGPQCRARTNRASNLSSHRRPGIYVTIMDNIVDDPCSDRAYLFFTDRHSMDRVGELVRGHRKHDLFMLKEFREDATPSLIKPDPSRRSSALHPSIATLHRGGAPKSCA